MTTLLPEERFNKKRAQQLCAYLMRWDGATRFSIDKCSALLYLCERQCYADYGMPLTYDRIIDTDHGPTVPRVVGILLGERNLECTMSEFRTEDVESVKFVLECYSGLTDDEVMEILRDKPEAKYALDGPISLETLLESVGYCGEEIMPQVANILDTQ
jgi:hypothetical protein